MFSTKVLLIVQFVAVLSLFGCSHVPAEIERPSCKGPWVPFTQTAGHVYGMGNDHGN